MPEQTQVLKSQAGIKRDGTKFDGDFYTDGQWVRFQRGLPRKIGGYKATQKYLTEVSRGFATFTQMRYVYCHSGGATLLERFTIDDTANSSIVTDRTPEDVAAFCEITLASGAAGSVDDITINGVSVMSGAEAFDTDLDTTATNVAANITAHTSTPNYTATAVANVITITADDVGSYQNGYTVVTSTTTIVATDTDMDGGCDALIEDENNMWMFDYQYDSSTNQNYLIAHVSPKKI